jgi:hypothetical protein
MAGAGSNEIGRVSVGVEAAGADATVAKLKEVETAGKELTQELQMMEAQAAGSVRRLNDAYNTSISGPGFGANFNTFDDPYRKGGSPAKPLREAAGAAAGITTSMNAASASAREAAGAAAGITTSMNAASASAGTFFERVKAFTQPLQNALGVISRVSGYLALISAAWSAINYLQEKANEAAKKHVESEKDLQELLERRKVILGQVIEDETDKKRAELEESHKKEIEDAKARSGNAVWLELRLAELKKKHAEELARFDERVSESSRQKNRDSEVKAYQDVLKETEAAENAARMEGLSEEQKIAEQLAQKRLDIERRISQTTDQYTIDLLNRQLAAAQTVADKQLAALQDKQAKERAALEERARAEAEKADQVAKAFSEALSREAQAFNDAIGSVVTQNQQRMAQMFDTTALLQRFDGIASALETLARQRGVR